MMCPLDYASLGLCGHRDGRQAHCLRRQRRESQGAEATAEAGGPPEDGQGSAVDGGGGGGQPLSPPQNVANINGVTVTGTGGSGTMFSLSKH
jgi:hypothetical protein